MGQENAWHTLQIAETFERLETGPEGLTQAEAQERLERYGPNTIEAEQRVSKVALLIEQLKNPLVVVLVVAAGISLLAGEEIDAIIIGAVLVVNTLIGFFQEYRAEEAIEALRARAAPEAEILRCLEGYECTEMRVKTENVVPGDLVLLSAGDKVPADARVVEAANLEVDESMLTGESVTVHKTTAPLQGERSVAERTNLVFAGTIVTQGRGRAVVFSTGAQTEMGRIATLIQETEKAESPLQRQMANLGKLLGLLALFFSTLVFVIGLWRGYELQEMFLFALASAISSIPEGLPAVLTITLAVGVNRMARRNAIIRRLRAVDTLGAATTICTDKTGTLTTNQMTVQQILADGRIIHVTGVGFAPEGHFEIDGEPVEAADRDTLPLLLTAAALCNDAHLRRHDVDGEHRWEIRGDPTEGALIVAAAKAGIHKEALEERLHRVDEVPFSAEDKYMVTFHRTPEGQMDVYAKGAPEVILDLCDRIVEDGRIRALDREDRERVLDVQEQMASQALRVLGVAYQTIAPEAVAETKEQLAEQQDGLILLGLTGMIDPPRPEVPDAVALCKTAGIRVVMATGDHQLTAEAIGREVGILQEDQRVLNGTDVQHMSDDDLDAAIDEVSVFARVSPGHKHRIVESLQRQGHVAAMTGDGVNDAPALEASAIGIAMGITGTDVTKETADMILTDDNFASIVSAVQEGRVVFQNVRKVVKFLISTNVGEDLTILASLLLFPAGQLIITPVQILWVNLVTDGLLDITLALEPEEGDVMDEPPRRPRTPIINREILFNVLYVSVFMAVGTLYAFTRANSAGNLRYAQTMAFTTMAMFQVFNALNCRSRTRSILTVGLFSNRYLIGAMILSVILQILANRLPFMQTALGTEPLSLADWGLILLLSGSVLVADEVRKLIQKWNRSRSR